MTLLRCAIRSYDRITVATLDGELDLHSAPDLDYHVGPPADAGHDLILDLARLRFLSAAGISAFCRLGRRARDSRGSMVLANPSVQVRRCLAIVDSEGALPVLCAVADVVVPLPERGDEGTAGTG